jgi:hypothetical protein
MHSRYTQRRAIARYSTLVGPTAPLLSPSSPFSSIRYEQVSQGRRGHRRPETVRQDGNWGGA